MMMPPNEQIVAAEQAGNPATIMKLRSGVMVMSGSQFLPGYCLLLAVPQVNTLTDLSFKQRGEFLLEMSLIGEAIEKVCQPRRINYAILGNKDPFLHAHIIPRYDWEDPLLQPLSIWHYSDAVWEDERYLFSCRKHTQLKEDLKQTMLSLMQHA